MPKGMVQGYNNLKEKEVKAAMLQVILMVEIGLIWMWKIGSAWHTKAKGKGHSA